MSKTRFAKILLQINKKNTSSPFNVNLNLKLSSMLSEVFQVANWFVACFYFGSSGVENDKLIRSKVKL